MAGGSFGAQYRETLELTSRPHYALGISSVLPSTILEDFIPFNRLIDFTETLNRWAISLSVSPLTTLY
jgi:hypothetical protein